MAKRIDNAEIKIEGFSFPNKGTAVYNGLKAEVANALPGQRVRCSLYKKKGKYQSNSFDVIQKADYEQPSDCPSFGVCGGCLLRTMPYEKQLELKKNTVLKLLSDAGVTGFEFGGILPSPEIYGYRNKMEFSFGDTGINSSLALGMRKRNSYYEVADASCCKIVHEDVTKILSATLNYFKNTGERFYHKTRHEGSLRHLLVRKSHFTGEIIAAIVTTSALSADLTEYKNELLSLNLDGNIVGVIHIINDSVADVIKADKTEILFGRDYFYEKLLGLTFKISLFSFFQTNSAGAEVLYKTVQNMAGADENVKTVFDLYCGTGTIAQLMSKTAQKVVGMEIVEEAVEAAKANAALNNISNCTFIAADVLKGIDSLSASPDLIILDPPREGLNPKALQKICQNFHPPKMIYISCKPASLARDLPLLKSHNYTPTHLTCVDMFPQTPHVENVVFMSGVEK